MLTVALFTHSARLSGAELFIERVASAMTRVRPVVVLGEPGPLEARLRERGVEVRVVPLVMPGARRVRPWRYSGELAAALRAAGADLLYTHSAKAHLLGGLAGRRAGIPVVSHAHDLLGPPARGRLGALAVRAGFTVLPHRRLANSELTRRSAGWASHLSWSVAPCPVELPPALVPAGAFRASRSGRVRLLVLGRLTEWKGQDLAIRALALLRESGREAVLDLVGEAQFAGDGGYAARLRALATELGVERHVRFRGHSEAPSAALRAADIVLHTSVRPEPFGQVVLEAMAEGKPVVLSDAAGVLEHLTPGGDCITYPMGNAECLALAVGSLVDSPSERARLSRAARWTAEEFQAGLVVPGLERVLIETWGRSGARTRTRPHQGSSVALEFRM